MARVGTDVRGSAAPAVAPDAQTPGRRRSWRRPWRRGLTALWHPSVVAVLVWLVAAPLAAVVPSALDVNPFRQAGAVVPLVLGGFIVAAIAGLALWRRSPVVTGAAAGLFAAWTVLLLRTAWHGTPFPAGGLYGDSGRLAAMATRYTVTSASSDGIVAGVPSEYPPLYPWLIGKTAVVLDVEAWRLLAPAAILAVSASIVIGFVLWSRLTSPGAALAISALGLVAFGKPDKAYEVLALAIVIPMLALTAAAPPRGRPHWLLAGLIGGFIALTYYAYLAYAMLGILVLVWQTWRAESDRRAYAWYLGRVVAVMLVVSSWYVIPYVWAMLHGGRQVADLYESSAITTNPLPFLATDPLGIAQLVGVAGLLWLRRTMWWAPPLLAIVLGAYGYYLINFARYVTTMHTGLLHYVFPLISACLLAAAVLTAAHVAPALARQVATPFPRGAGAAVISIVLIFAGYTYWHANMPVTLWRPGPTGPARPDGDLQNLRAARAHTQPFPNGGRPRFSTAAGPAGRLAWFPVEPVQRAVEGVLGNGARPRTLAYDEKLFAFLPWRGYIGVDRTSSFGPARWDDRYAELTRVSKFTDPAAFAQASAHTKFGPIDVFVLRRDKTDLVWRPVRPTTALRFQPQQFDPKSFVVVDDLPQDTVVAIRRR
jgi:hypothetical protein